MPGHEVIALFGPTAVGKTAVAIQLAKRLREQGEDPVAVSADALQVYRGLEILTGAASATEQNQLEHRLISFLPVDATFSAGQYAKLAHNEIDGLHARARVPIVVGGTGLYLRAALADLELRPPPAAGVRERWTTELNLHGPEVLHGQLARVAPRTAAAIAPTDSHRIVRALELHDAGELKAPSDQSELWTQTTRRSTLLIGLTAQRDSLYEHIDARVDAMLEAGVEDEVRRADAAGASETARRALGFEDVLSGDIDGMKRRTRNYARRQLTWMRKLPGVTQVDVTDRRPDDVAAEIAGHWLR
jgi:tRNA dimethylallyltransferase